MKKNLFLLFSIYFFVLQPAVIWILRWQENFFWLWAINLLAIILIGLLYTTVEWIPEQHKEHKEYETPVKETKVAFHEQFRSTIHENKKKSELIMPFILSFIVSIFIFFMFQHNSTPIAFVLVFALILGFIVFFGFNFLVKHRITKKFRALLGTKTYLILLFGSLLWTAYDYYQANTQFNVTFQEYIGQNFFGQAKLTTDWYVFTGQWTVLWTGSTQENQTIQGISSDVITGTTQDSTIQEATGTVVATSADNVSTNIQTDTQTTGTTSVSTSQGQQKLMDAIISLVKKYNLPLVTKQNVSFTYVSFQNPYYNEWRTAYANKLIGKNTNPSKYIICDTYIVMKGILEKRDVSYTASNVLANYRAEAVKRDALNGCKKGMIVDASNL